MQNFTGTFLDIRISNKVRMNVCPEGKYSHEVLNIRKYQLLPSHCERQIFREHLVCVVWYGSIWRFIGLHSLPARVSDRDYLNFLQRHKWTIWGCVRNYVLVQHDRVPPRYSHEVCHWRSENYPGRWLDGRHKAVASWPARSPDFSPPCILFLWGYSKFKVYASSVCWPTREES
jgi:hypothetical protein